MKRWWIGCSGFYYRHWRETFYPAGLPQRRWFEYYCNHFNTVELNVTFYRYPKLSALRGWYDRSPDDFLFTVKAPRLITHYRKFQQALREATDFYDLVGDGLQNKLACVLFQLPPNLVYSPSALDNILKTLDPAFTNVVEFRHDSWWNEAVYQSFKGRGIAFSGISYPELPDQVIRSVPVLYYRFHGVPQLYASPYTMPVLKRVAGDIRKTRGVRDVFVYFNNDIHASAIRNAREFMQIITPGRGPDIS